MLSSDSVWTIIAILALVSIVLILVLKDACTCENHYELKVIDSKIVLVKTRRIQDEESEAATPDLES